MTVSEVQSVLDAYSRELSGIQTSVLILNNLRSELHSSVIHGRAHGEVFDSRIFQSLEKQLALQRKLQEHLNILGQLNIGQQRMFEEHTGVSANLTLATPVKSSPSKEAVPSFTPPSQPSTPSKKGVTKKGVTKKSGKVRGKRSGK